MASLINCADGSKEVQWVDHLSPDTRRKLRLGKVTVKVGNGVKDKVEKLVYAKSSGTALDASVAEWVATMPAKHAKNLAKWGLIEPRADLVSDTIISFVDGYLAKRTDVKPRTKLNHQQARGFVLAYFGTEKRLSEVTPLDAKQFRTWMLKEGHAENYVRTQCKNIKMFFGAAVDDRRLEANPFKGIPSKSIALPDKQRFIPADDVKAILAKMPGVEWRLLTCLARWAGLRVPSEILELRWEHVDWEHNRITILVPKLHHIEGKDRRVVPIFPEILPTLLEAAEARGEHDQYVLPTLREVTNLRTTFNKYVVRANLKPWGKTFMNLRSTRETELVELYPLRVVSDWLGHDPTISIRNYQQVLPEHWERASAVPTPARKTGAFSGAVCDRLEQVGAVPETTIPQIP